MRLGAERDRTLLELAHQWLEVADHEASTANTSRHVLERYVLRRLGDRYVDELVTRDLDDLYVALGRELAPATVLRVHGVVRAALEQGVRWGWLSVNPAVGARAPRRPPAEPNPPAPAVVEGLIETAITDGDHSMAMLVRLAAVTGARPGETIALQTGDYQGDAMRIARAFGTARGGRAYEKPTKTRRARVVALDAATRIELELYLEHLEGRWLFAEAPGQPTRPQTVTRRFARLRARAGHPEVQLRELRHFCATQLLSAGVDVRTVAARLGHSPATLLNIYAGWLPASDQRAAEVMGGLLDRG